MNDRHRLLPRLLGAPLVLAAAWALWVYASTRRELAGLDRLEHLHLEDVDEDEVQAQLTTRGA